MKEAFQGWKDAMPKDWTGGKLLDGNLDGWMKMAKKDEISREKHISIQRVFFKMLFYHFLMVRYVIWGHGKNLECGLVEVGILCSS